MNSQARLEKLKSAMATSQLDAVALIPGANFRYLTGSVHHVMERPLVLFVDASGRSAVVIPTLEVELFESHGFGAYTAAWSDADGYDNAFAEVSNELSLGGKRIGVEGRLIRYFEIVAMQEQIPDGEPVDAHDLISSIRLHKDSVEIEALRFAIHQSETAFRKTLEQVRVGMTERQVANILVQNLNATDGESLSFEPIVLAADNSARPHGTVRDNYAIQPGDALLFDFGVTYQGYHADITRTVFVGEPSDHQRAIYEAVRKANEIGRGAVKPGVVASTVDAQTAQSLRDSGFGDFILHRTGHGLGLDVHEAPNIVAGNDAPLEAGMVFTIEPGLYQTGALGVRIEDNVVVTQDGCETLTSFPRDLLVIG